MAIIGGYLFLSACIAFCFYKAYKQPKKQPTKKEELVTTETVIPKSPIAPGVAVASLVPPPNPFPNLTYILNILVINRNSLISNPSAFPLILGTGNVKVVITHPEYLDQTIDNIENVILHRQEMQWKS